MDLTTSQTEITDKTSNAVMKRYKDAYVVAKFVNGVGAFIKTIGLVIGIGSGLMIMGLFERGFRSNDGTLMLGALVVGGIVFLIFYICGLLVSAQGQILKASLDGAVNSSPFLDKKLKAKVMSVPD